VNGTVTSLLAGGHVLLEGIPGVGKTSLVHTLADVLHLKFSRIQFTPDLMPADIVGTNIVQEHSHGGTFFEFQPGPIFANVVLADEINRATPKTQSALLEAMAEYQVTVDGVTRDLPYPFLLIATENPIEYEGTFPLPEAQLDRFFLRTALGYPGLDDELKILDQQRYAHPLEGLEPAVSLEDIHELRTSAQHVYVDDVIQRWLVELVRSTRDHESVVIGSSVRGSLALERAARAWALLSGRGFVIPEDIERLFVPVLIHRVVFTPSFVARARASSWEDAIEEFRVACLQLAPRPGSEEDPIFEHPNQ
jgi:MoxR-like ATPase